MGTTKEQREELRRLWQHEGAVRWTVGEDGLSIVDGDRQVAEVGDPGDDDPAEVVDTARFIVTACSELGYVLAAIRARDKSIRRLRACLSAALVWVPTESASRRGFEAAIAETEVDLDEADARDAEIAGLRSQVREAQRERDENRVTLNAIANDLRVVHEDPKILAAFRKIHSERGELRACLRIAIDGFDRGAPMNSTDYKRIRAALGETEPT
jgi:hypothetical protein